MRARRARRVLLGAVCILTAHHALPAQASGVVNRMVDGIPVIESVTPAWTAATRWHVDSVPILVLGSAAGALEEQFGKVSGAVRLSDGTVVVADGKAFDLRVFDASGKFRTRIGRKGEGPGDFQWITALLTASDTIVVADARASRLTYFDRTGRVLRTVPVQQLPIIPSPDGHGGSRSVIVVRGRFPDGAMLATSVIGRMDSPTGFYRDSVRVWRVDTDGRITQLGTIFSSENWIYRYSGGINFDSGPFGRIGVTAVTPRGYAVSTGTDYGIAEYSPAGKLSRVLRIRRTLAPVTPRDIAEYKTETVKTESPGFQKIREEANNWLTYPRTFPAFDSLVVDGAGRIWARNYSKAVAPARWDVFDTAGRHLGTVQMPAVFDVLQIGRDFLLARAKGDDDEESVRLYRLRSD